MVDDSLVFALRNLAQVIALTFTTPQLVKAGWSFLALE